MIGCTGGAYDALHGILAIRKVCNEERDSAKNESNIFNRICQCILLNGGLFAVFFHLLITIICFLHSNNSFKQFIYAKGLNIGIQSSDPQMAIFFHTIYFWITTRNSVFDLVLVRAHSFLYFLNVLGFAAFLHKSNRKCLMVSGIITNKSHFNNYELEVKYIEFVLKSGHRRHCIQRTSAIVSYNI